jgi:2-keto-4-pentenoate hydratase/2-oxohepta-3-ene-1,7-dioic acid hydratase in catechol pathway
VPADKLDRVLRVQTHVNGELRQDATTDDLIFSIPHLIKTMSEGQTLMPGDILATGTVGLCLDHICLGRNANVYLACRRWHWKETTRLPRVW